jgi:hypothetical protein
VEEKEKLSQIIAGIETGRESSIPPLSPDQELAVVRRSLPDRDQQTLDRILSVVESKGPLQTKQILTEMDGFSEASAKESLSKLCKIGVLGKGNRGYSRRSGEVGTK